VVIAPREIAWNLIHLRKSDRTWLKPGAADRPPISRLVSRPNHP